MHVDSRWPTVDSRPRHRQRSKDNGRLIRIRYRRPSTLDCRRNRVEARFDLPPGKLAGMEAIRPGGAVFALERGGELVGLARFHPELAPDLGILFPLRAASAADAQILVAACVRGAALPPVVEIFVESAAPRAWLVAAGHAPFEEHEVMGGAIPP